MKTPMKYYALLFLSIALVGCAGTKATTQETDDVVKPSAAAISSESNGDTASSDDHHAGETNVPPHRD